MHYFLIQKFFLCTATRQETRKNIGLTLRLRICIAYPESLYRGALWEKRESVEGRNGAPVQKLVNLSSLGTEIDIVKYKTLVPEAGILRS